MKNSTKYVGKRILDVRKAKGLTQNELCGSEITRNHLSLIESGKALPSLGAICYLADRLEVPVGFFFSDDKNEDAKYLNHFALDSIKDAFAEDDFETCIQLAEDIPEEIMGDEIALILARACFEKALHFADKLAIGKSKMLMRRVSELTNKSCYLDRDIAAAAEYYELLFDSIAYDSVPKKLTDFHEASSYTPIELILYLKAVSDIKYGFVSEHLISPKHKQHADALNAIEDGKFEAAFNMLHDLSEHINLPYYMRYKVYDGLEKCAERLGRFEIAYSAAKHKLEMKNL